MVSQKYILKKIFQKNDVVLSENTIVKTPKNTKKFSQLFFAKSLVKGHDHLVFA